MFEYFTFACKSSGVTPGSYGIGLPTCVRIFTGNPPKMGAQGNFVRLYNLSQNLRPQLTHRNASRKFSVNTGIIGLKYRLLVVL